MPHHGEHPGAGYTAILAGPHAVDAGMAVIMTGVEGHHMGPVQIDGGPVHAFAHSSASEEGQPFRVHETGRIWLTAGPGEVISPGDPIAALAGGYLRRAQPGDIACGRAHTATTGGIEPERFSARVTVEPSQLFEHPLP